MKRVQKNISLSDLMPQVIQTRLGKKYWDFYLLSSDWAAIVGEHIAAQARPAWMKKDVLWLHVTAPVWSQEIQLIKPELLKKIRSAFPESGINDIRCLHEPTHRSTESRPSPQSRPTNQPVIAEQDILKLTAALPDTKARQALYAFWKKINPHPAPQDNKE